MLERVLFDPVCDKPKTGVEPPGPLIVADHGQLQQFDVLAGKIDHPLHEPPPDASPSCIGPNIHAPEQAFMRFLHAFAYDEPGSSQQFTVIKCAKHRGTAKSFREARQWLGVFGLERATEGFRIASEPGEPNLPIQVGISRDQLPNLNVSSIHATPPSVRRSAMIARLTRSTGSCE